MMSMVVADRELFSLDRPATWLSRRRVRGSANRRAGRAWRQSRIVEPRRPKSKGFIATGHSRSRPCADNPAMVKPLTNWAGNFEFSAREVLQPSSVDELRAAVRGREHVKVL